MVVGLHEGNEVRVVVAGDNQNLLARVPLLIRVLEDIAKTVIADRDHDPLERDPTTLIEEQVLLRVPAKGLHISRIEACVPFVISCYGWLGPAGARNRADEL